MSFSSYAFGNEANRTQETSLSKNRFNVERSSPFSSYLDSAFQWRRFYSRIEPINFVMVIYHLYFLDINSVCSTLSRDSCGRASVVEGFGLLVRHWERVITNAVPVEEVGTGFISQNK